MKFSKSLLVNGAMVAVFAAGTLAATGAAAKSYVVCNSAGDCWHVHQRYTDYPAGIGIVYHDDAWWAKHQHESNWHWQADRTDDHGWYDSDGAWHAFAPPP